MAALIDRLDAKTPKKILSLDGGGIRGALTLGYLKKIETILKEKYPSKGEEFRMSDYFDLIGGTSTGSIIASLLAMGNTVDHIIDLYMKLGDKIFAEKRAWWNPKSWFATYGFGEMVKGLKFAYGEDTTIGSDKIKTGLCIVAKRADTNSIWPMNNHPRGKYYGGTGNNKDYLLWQVVRASTAAPTYFKPQILEVGQKDKPQPAAFIDGGLSMANNPSLNLLMVATLKGFPFQWPMGEDKMFLVSLGTGIRNFKRKVKEIDNAWLGTWASSIPEILMQDASWQNQLLMQWLSNSDTAESLDSEIGKLDGDYISGSPLLTYLRYNVQFTAKELNALNMGRTFTEEDAVKISDMANPKNKELLLEIGSAASSAIKAEHFAKFQ